MDLAGAATCPRRRSTKAGPHLRLKFACYNSLVTYSTHHRFSAMRFYAREWVRKSLLSVAFTSFSLLPAAAQQHAVRDVTPPGVTRVYRSSDSPAFAPKLVDVRIASNGQLQSNGGALKLYGISLPPRQKVCVTASGTRWACGLRAYIALRNLFAQRSLSCQPKDDDKPAAAKMPRLVVCKIDDADVALSLLQDGLADLAAGVSDQAYIAAESLAKSKKIGLWADGPQ